LDLLLLLLLLVRLGGQKGCSKRRPQPCMGVTLVEEEDDEEDDTGCRLESRQVILFNECVRTSEARGGTVRTVPFLGVWVVVGGTLDNIPFPKTPSVPILTSRCRDCCWRVS
jgi:hypothetical protein